MIKVVLAGNDRMFDCVFLNAISIATRTKEEVEINFLTLDLSKYDKRFISLTKEHEELIQSTLKKLNSKVSFKTIDVSELFWKYMGKDKYIKYSYTPYSLLRLLIGYIPSLTGNVIYLDCDTMLASDINEFSKIDMTDTEICACRDILGKFWINKYYFNAGSLLFNVDLCRETKLFEKAIKIFETHHHAFGDQSALNHAVTKLKYFPGREFRFNEQREMKEDTVVKHFCQGMKWTPYFHVFNYKQTDFFSVHYRLKIHQFDNDIAIYKKAIEEKNHQNNDVSDEPILVVKNLVKKYGELTAVNNISFEVKRGSLFGFLGVNGAGKSTTINIIASILSKNDGKIFVDGLDLDDHVQEIKSKIGIVFQNSVLDENLTVWENLLIRSKFYDLSKKEREERLDSIITTLNLYPILKQPVGKLSGGQRRRVDIARAMLHNPKLLILDEPTTGLDPKTRIDVWKLVDKIRQEKNMTVFLTSHYLEEADQATDVIIMDHGNIIAHGTPTELKNDYSENYVLVYREQSEDFEKAIKGYKFIYSEDNLAYTVTVKTTQDAFKFIETFRDIIPDFEVKKGNLDDVFINVTRKVDGGKK